MPALLETGVRALVTGLVAACIAVLPAIAHAAEDGPGPKQRIDDWLAANESFRADFTQSVFDEDGYRIAMSLGTVVFRRPNRFRWDYDPPGAQTIVADGRELWWYDVDLQQVTVRSVEKTLDGTPAALLAGPREAGEHFLISSLPSTDDLEWIELVPRDAGAGFRTIRVGMRGVEMLAVEMLDGFGQTTRIDFFDAEYNPHVSDELFRFEPPPEADVVRGE